MSRAVAAVKAFARSWSWEHRMEGTTVADGLAAATAALAEQGHPLSAAEIESAALDGLAWTLGRCAWLGGHYDGVPTVARLLIKVMWVCGGYELSEAAAMRLAVESLAAHKADQVAVDDPDPDVVLCAECEMPHWTGAHHTCPTPPPKPRGDDPIPF